MMDCASSFKKYCWAALLVGLLFGGTAFGAGRDAAATVVVYNKSSPDSKSLALYYAGRRNIPPAQVIGLNCPESEEITRSDYEAWIAAPLRKIFRSKGWWKFGRDVVGANAVTYSTIRYVAIMRGMPLKIAHDPTIPPADFVRDMPIEITSRNEASVDSEIATLGMMPKTPAGVFPNPYYRRFTPILEDPIPLGILLPARLDGPTASIVRAMIDDSLDAERDGLRGWSYVDGRGITSGGYAEGDAWMSNAVRAMREQGLPVIFDQHPETFPPGFPVTDAAIYYGWYAASVEGPFAQPGFTFRPGAVAVHLHSFSASTLRSATSSWCGPLLARGAAATLGNVYEPYLALTANFDIFQDRLMSGFTLAESGWMSQRALSWMGVLVGDPLYRPYAAWRNGPPTASDAWQQYRSIILKAGGRVTSAADALQQAGQKSRNSLFDEALGAARMDENDWAGAVESFASARALASSPAVRIRLDLESVVSLKALGKNAEATALAQTASAALEPGPQKDLFQGFLPAPPPATEMPLESHPQPPADQAPMKTITTPPTTPTLPTPTPTPEPTPEPTPTPTPVPLPPAIPEMRP